MPEPIVFIEHNEVEVTDKPHCGDCYTLVDAPHCGECVPAAVAPESALTDKPHCGDCFQ